MKKVLVIAAHSDDEALGCAGTMARHVAEGDEVHVMFMTDGVGSRNSGQDDVSQRTCYAQEAGKIIGVSSIINFDFPDNKMDSMALLDIVQAIEAQIEVIQPNVIYTHHIGDLNIDHQVTHKAVMTACRPQPGFFVKEIYAFEVLSSTEWQTPGHYSFTPNVFVDISDYMVIKRKVLEVYKEEMRISPHSRSIENATRVNMLRGNTVGFPFAEAFVLVRCLKG